MPFQDSSSVSIYYKYWFIACVKENAVGRFLSYSVYAEQFLAQQSGFNGKHIPQVSEEISKKEMEKIFQPLCLQVIITRWLYEPGNHIHIGLVQRLWGKVGLRI